MLTEKARENRARRQLQNWFGFRLKKSRTRHIHIDDFGEYQILEENRIIAGEKFDLDLEDVEAFIQEGRAAAEGQEVD